MPSLGDGAPPIGDSRFLALLDTLPYPAFVILSGGHGLHFNTPFVAYLGFTPGPDTAARTALHHPDDQAALVAARMAGVAAAADYVVQARLLRHDGQHRWHRIHNKPLFQDGQVAAWLGTAVDLHDQRMQEELLEQRVRARTAELEQANQRLRAEQLRYRELYNRTPMALQSADARARLLDVNDTWVEIFGHARASVIGRSPSEFMTPASAQVYHARAWPEMLASGGAVRVVDYQFVTATGRVFDGRLAARGVFDAAGGLLRTWSAIVDVTAEKQADRTLRQSQRLDAIGQLTAGLAHDFNNLLTAILGNLELALRPGPPDAARQERLIGGARQAAQRGATLTAQLLAFSRQQRIVVGPVDVGGLIESMRPLLHGAIRGGIALEIDTAPTLPPALADATQIEMAVLNLVLNARDALGETGRIRVSTTAAAVDAPLRPEEPEAGNHVAISVADDGPGIADAVRERMFEPFFTTKEAGRGSGLGLSQVLGIAKQMGGGLRVRSSAEGTTVCILLPVAAGAAHGDRAEEGPVVAPAATARVGRVLLVDDDPDVRATAGLMLRELGHAVVEADGGPAALAALAEAAGGFDLMLADVVMPGMKGTELVAQARAAWPDVPAVLMTGYADAGQFPAALVEAALGKPFRSAELAARVAEAMRDPAGPGADRRFRHASEQ